MSVADALFCSSCGLRVPLEEGYGTALVVDVETTGLSSRDEILEFSAAVIEFRRASGEIVRIEEHYSGQREPSCPISIAAQKVHGISKRSVEDKRLDEDRIARLVRGSEFIVAHNAPFDQRFVHSLFPALSGVPWKCSLNGVNWLSHGFESLRLQDLLRSQGIASGEGDITECCG